MHAACPRAGGLSVLHRDRNDNADLRRGNASACFVAHAVTQPMGAPRALPSPAPRCSPCGLSQTRGRASWSAKDSSVADKRPWSIVRTDQPAGDAPSSAAGAGFLPRAKAHPVPHASALNLSPAKGLSPFAGWRSPSLLHASITSSPSRLRSSGTCSRSRCER